MPSLLRLLERRTQPGIFLHLPPPRIEGGTAAIKIGSPWLAWFATALAPADPNRHLPYPGPFARCGPGAVEVGALYWRREGSTMVHFIVAAVWLIKRRRCTSSYVDLVKKTSKHHGRCRPMANSLLRPLQRTNTMFLLSEFLPVANCQMAVAAVAPGLPQWGGNHLHYVALLRCWYKTSYVEKV